MGPAIDQHARPRHRDAAQDAVRPARRARHRFRHRLPDRRARHSAHRRRRDPPRRDPRLQHRHRRVFREAQRPADPGRGDPDAHARGGDRGARVLRQAARLEGRHVRQQRRAAIAGHEGSRRQGPRPAGGAPRGAVRPVRPRQRLRLRPGLAEMPRTRRRADLPHRRPRLRAAQQPEQLHLQPYRPFRGGRARGRQGAVPRRRHAGASRICASASSKAASAGAASSSPI